MLNNPEHVAFIMDGNGRWALRRGLPRSAGHVRGIRSIYRVVKEARKMGLQFVTLFAFSTENWRRTKDEVNYILMLLERYLKKEALRLAGQDIRVKVIGDRATLPKSLLDAVMFAEQATSNAREMILTLAISYGGQDDIVQAARRMVEQKRESSSIDRELFAQNLFYPDLPPVDLLIRTGDEQRLSNFMLWHLAYAELIFLPLLWPDFAAFHLTSCIELYKRRQRRFGREL